MNMPKLNLSYLMSLLVLFALVSLQPAFSNQNQHREIDPERSTSILVRARDGTNLSVLQQKFRSLVHQPSDIKHIYEHVFKGGNLEVPVSRLDQALNEQSLQLVEFNRIIQQTADLKHFSYETTKQDKSSLEHIGVNQINPQSLPLEDITVAVVDSQIDGDHPYLRDQMVGQLNALSDHPKNKRFDKQMIQDHGTHVAGTIAGKTGRLEDRIGVAPGVNILGITVFHPIEPGTNGDLVNGLDLVLKKSFSEPIEVVNLSVGIPSIFGLHWVGSLGQAVRSIRDAGISVVTAAGNDGGNVDGWIKNSAPASFHTTITVSAMNFQSSKRPRLARFSNYGELVDVTAPGVGITSSVVSGYQEAPTAELSGTSMASPHVTGAVALIEAAARKQGKDPSPKQIRTILKKSGKKPSDTKKWKADPDGITEPLIMPNRAIQLLSQ